MQTFWQVVMEWWQSVAASVTNKDSFLYFQLKDLTTFAVACMGFMVAYASLRINYLRSPHVRPQMGRTLRWAVPGRAIDAGLMIYADAILFNIGAQAALIDYAQIKICKRRWLIFSDTVTVLEWTWFVKTGDIAEPGEARKIWTNVDTPAVAIAVPKYELVVKAVQFNTRSPVDLMPGSYWIRIQSLQMNDKRRLYNRRRRFYHSPWRRLILKPEDITYLGEKTCMNDQGVRLSHLHLNYRSGAYRSP